MFIVVCQLVSVSDCLPSIVQQFWTVSKQLLSVKAFQQLLFKDCEVLPQLGFFTTKKLARFCFAREAFCMHVLYIISGVARIG